MFLGRYQPIGSVPNMFWASRSPASPEPQASPGVGVDGDTMASPGVSSEPEVLSWPRKRRPAGTPFYPSNGLTAAEKQQAQTQHAPISPEIRDTQLLELLYRVAPTSLRPQPKPGSPEPEDDCPGACGRRAGRSGQGKPDLTDTNRKDSILKRILVAQYAREQPPTFQEKPSPEAPRPRLLALTMNEAWPQQAVTGKKPHKTALLAELGAMRHQFQAALNQALLNGSDPQGQDNDFQDPGYPNRKSLFQAIHEILPAHARGRGNTLSPTQLKVAAHAMATALLRQAFYPTEAACQLTSETQYGRPHKNRIPGLVTTVNLVSNGWTNTLQNGFAGRTPHKDRINGVAPKWIGLFYNRIPTSLQNQFGVTPYLFKAPIPSENEAPEVTIQEGLRVLVEQQTPHDLPGNAHYVRNANAPGSVVGPIRRMFLWTGIQPKYLQDRPRPARS